MTARPATIRRPGSRRSPTSSADVEEKPTARRHRTAADRRPGHHRRDRQPVPAEEGWQSLFYTRKCLRRQVTASGCRRWPTGSTERKPNGSYANNANRPCTRSTASTGPTVSIRRPRNSRPRSGQRRPDLRSGLAWGQPALLLLAVPAVDNWSGHRPRTPPIVVVGTEY